VKKFERKEEVPAGVKGGIESFKRLLCPTSASRSKLTALHCVDEKKKKMDIASRDAERRYVALARRIACLVYRKGGNWVDRFE